MLVIGLFVLTTGTQGQPLLKTHVETGDVEGVVDGNLAVYRAIPYAAPLSSNIWMLMTRMSFRHGREEYRSWMQRPSEP